MSIELSERGFEVWDWLLVLTKGWFGSILINENVVLITPTTESVALFGGAGGDFKSSVEELIHTLDLIPIKKLY